MLNSGQNNLFLGELVSALNFALNLTATLIPGHCDRAAFMAVRLGSHLGYSDDTLAELRFMVQLKDVGCDSNASKVAEMFMAEDFAIGNGAPHSVAALRDQLREVTTYIDEEETSVSKLGKLAVVLARKGAFAPEYYDKSCLMGAEVTRMMRFPETVSNGILDLNEHWDGSGQPRGKSGLEISLFSRIALLTQVADVFAVAYDPQRAMQEVLSRSGTMLDPQLVDGFSQIATEAFWTGARAPDVAHYLAKNFTNSKPVAVDDAYLNEIAKAFAKVIKFKSPYTTAHSQRVADLAREIGKELDYGSDEQAQLWRAGLLHDIGKLGISSLILDKPDALAEREYDLVRRHAKLGEDLLSRVDVLKDLSKIVGRHHEMLDGSGYPRGLTGADIDTLTRVLSVADIFDALTSERPYRPEVSVKDAIDILDGEFGDCLEGRVVDALKNVLKLRGTI